MDEDLKKQIKEYPKNTALIRVRWNGKTFSWAMGASPKGDDEESLRAHVKRWYPDAEFLGYAIH